MSTPATGEEVATVAPKAPNDEEAVIVSDDAPVFTTHSESEADRMKTIKVLNALSYAITALLTLSTVLFSATEGLYGDEFAWMQYQTLFTPATYVRYIWLVIFALHGCFVYASCLDKEMQHSPLVGYSFMSGAEDSSDFKSSLKSSVAMNYPGVCATVLMMIYSFDHGWMGFAFASALLCLAVLVNVLKIQYMASMLMANVVVNNVEKNDDVYVKQEDETNQSGIHLTDESDKFFTKENVKNFVFLKLPFELTFGYVLSLAALCLNAWFDSNESLPTTVHLILANLSMIGLLIVGICVLLKFETKYYGVGCAVVWYMLGVAIELITPSQPIYNAFSDGAISVTQLVAYLATTILLVTLTARAAKTAIKLNLFNCVPALAGGDASASVVSEDDVSECKNKITTDYVHA